MPIETVAETGSTNADLAARLAGGTYVREGHWLVADRQSAGRGRLGRAWSDAAGNFMGSTVVHQRPGDPSTATLALLTGLALHEVIAPLLQPPHRAQLKWPNDVLVHGAKLAGILLQQVGEAVVVGIGVNLASAPDIPDRPATDLARFGPAPQRDAFAAALARHFDQELERWRSFGLELVLNRWHAAAHPPGTPLAVTGAPGEALNGTYDGLERDGALRLRLADGTTRAIHAGDVSLV